MFRPQRAATSRQCQEVRHVPQASQLILWVPRRGGTGAGTRVHCGASVRCLTFVCRRAAPACSLHSPAAAPHRRGLVERRRAVVCWWTAFWRACAQVSAAQRCAPNCGPARRAARVHARRRPALGPRVRRAFTGAGGCGAARMCAAACFPPARGARSLARRARPSTANRAAQTPALRSAAVPSPCFISVP